VRLRSCDSERSSDGITRGSPTRHRERVRTRVEAGGVAIRHARRPRSSPRSCPLSDAETTTGSRSRCLRGRNPPHDAAEDLSRSRSGSAPRRSRIPRAPRSCVRASPASRRARSAARSSSRARDRARGGRRSDRAQALPGRRTGSGGIDAPPADSRGSPHEALHGKELRRDARPEARGPCGDDDDPFMARISAFLRVEGSRDRTLGSAVDRGPHRGGPLREVVKEYP
jgi:hypothetical protein